MNDQTSNNAFDHGFSTSIQDASTTFNKTEPLISSDETASSHYGPSTRLSRDAKSYYSATAVSIAVPLVALIVWLSLNPSNWKKAGWSTIHSAVIGGRLTQSQAKAVDLLSSGFIAPLILGSLNYIWFACARVAVVNEHKPSPAGLPLHSLVEVSSTTGGSYDILKLHALLRPRTRRLMCLALLVIFSAVAKTALGNVIAYEAFSEAGAGQSPDLRLLNDKTVASASPFPSSTFTGLYGYDRSQLAAFANQFTGMMTGISLDDARSKLTNDSYTMVNATTASLDALPQNVAILHEVPAHQWSTNCSSMQANNQTFSMLQMGEQAVQYNVMGTGKNAGLFQGQFPGDVATLQGATNEVYPLMAFSLDGSSAWLGFLTSFDRSNDSYTSPFGNVVPIVVNMTNFGFNGTKQIMSLWGMQCSITQKAGAIEMSRANDGTWKPNMQTAQWGSQVRIVKPLRLQQLQTNLNYRAPEATLPGLMPALASSADPLGMSSFETLSLNFLYASAESERIAYEVAAKNSSSTSLSDSTYTVVTTQAVLKYRITYVPLILFIGIAALLCAAVTTMGLVVYSLRSRSVSARRFRQVDVLRLVADGATTLDLKNSGRGMIDGSESNGELEAWAKSYMVRYEREYADVSIGKSGERTNVVLQHIL